MSLRTSIVLVAVGSLLAGGSCLAIGLLGGFAGIGVTPFTLAGWLVGLAAVFGGWAFLGWLALRAGQPRDTKDHPARRRDGNPTRRRGVSRVQTTAVRRARTRGGKAEPLRDNGGEGSAAPTEELPAVDDDGEPLTVLIPLSAAGFGSPGSGHRAGRGYLPLGFGRPAHSSTSASRPLKGPSFALSRPGPPDRDG